MCGIAGSVNFRFDADRLRKDLYHRGPDEQSSFEEGNLQLHHTRLSIVDISGGKQPMHYGPFTIIYNGEMYNHLEIRERWRLECSTHSDTETILHAFAKFGPDCLDAFDGTFALAIYDREKRSVFLARGRNGKKPLYYYSRGDVFVFASELNALRHQLPLEMNEEQVHDYMRMGFFFDQHTVYKDVYELRAGSYTYVPLDNPKADVKKWWDIHPFYLKHNKDSFETALQKTDELLHYAIKNRVESSDLEVGSFLSGGIDSGLVTAIAKKYNSSLKTFTVSFDGVYDEAPLAKLVAERYGTHHHEIRIDFDHLLNDVETILYNYGEPFFDSSAIPSYYVSKEARKYLTVILNGDGGDEIFGGYRRYVPFAKYDFFNSSAIIHSLANIAHAILPASHDKTTKYNFIYRLTDLARKKGLDTYLASTLDIFTGYEKYLTRGKMLSDDIVADFNRINQAPLSGLQKLMNLDYDNLLTGNLLVKMDIATMSNSLEGRSPFMSKGLVEYIPSISDSFKINGTQTKFLLRELAKKYLPPELIYQPKRGFEIPLKKWIDGELNELIRSYLFSPQSISKNFIASSFINDLWNRKINVGDEKRAKMIWTMFALEVWYKKCYLAVG